MGRSESVVTMRSALDLRDRAIRYGVFQCMSMVCMCLAFLIAIGLLGFMWLVPEWHSNAIAFVGPGAVLGGALFVGALALKGSSSAVYPHTPRVSLEEFESMMNDGIPEAVLAVTAADVIVGSEEEWNAQVKTTELLDRLRKANGSAASS